VTAQTNAETLAAAFRSRIGDIVRCDRATEGCFLDFARDFGRRAFRRPLTQEQVSGLLGIYRVGLEESPDLGFELAVQAVLQSPSFLYRLELGSPLDTKKARLSAHEIAEQLAFGLTNAPPDAELARLADDGRLLAESVYLQQLDRLLATDPGRAILKRFLTNLVSAQSVHTVQKAQELFPDFDAATRADLVREMEHYADDVFSVSGATVAELFTSKHTFMNERVARVYGVEGVVGQQFRRVALDSPHRSGFLTKPLVMAIYSQSDHVVPTARGRFVYNQLLCRQMGTPPVIDPTLPAADPKLDARQRLEVLKGYPACASCHVLADPIGFAFESLNPIGALKASPSMVIDTSGHLPGASSQSVLPFSDSRGLGSRLASHPDSEGCMVMNFSRFYYGRMERQTDACGVSAVVEKVRAQGGTLRAVVRETARSSWRLERSLPTD
jgi:hypothetical protein